MNENAIDRKLVCAFIAGLISDDGERKKGLEYIRNMPPVTPQPSISQPDIEAIRQEIETEMNLCRMKDTVSKGYKGKILEEVLGKIDKYIQKPQEKWIDEDDNRYICKECEYAHKPQKEPCEDAISRQAVIDSLHSKFADGFDSDRWWNSMSVLYVINKVPPVNPTKTGHWVGEDGKPSHLQDGMTTESVWCSECGKWLTASDEYSCDGKFCPNCGTRMVEPQERSDKE